MRHVIPFAVSIRQVTVGATQSGEYIGLRFVGKWGIDGRDRRAADFGDLLTIEGAEQLRDALNEEIKEARRASAISNSHP